MSHLRDELVTPLWRDAHLHLRQDAQIPLLASATDRWCSHAVVMPNTTPPIDTPERVTQYLTECTSAMFTCKPLVTVYLTPQMRPETLRACFKVGAVAVKVYPADQTSNSHHGITRDAYLQPTQQFIDCLGVAQEEDKLVLWHGELPGEWIVRSENAFCRPFSRIVQQFPRLRMVLEHITTEEGIETVRSLARMYPVRGTITMHHLWMQNGTDDFMRPKLRPDWFCMPIAKSPEDWVALITAIREPMFFLGTDSAPHSPENKYCPECCAGCFTAPHPEMLVQIFEEQDAMTHLVPFVTERMGEFYRLGPPTGELKFRREGWTVPDNFYGYVPFLAHWQLKWKLA